jgi:hypothetical protein
MSERHIDKDPKQMFHLDTSTAEKLMMNVDDLYLIWYHY